MNCQNIFGWGSLLPHNTEIRTFQDLGNIEFWYRAVHGTGTRYANLNFMNHHKISSIINLIIFFGLFNHEIPRYAKT